MSSYDEADSSDFVEVKRRRKKSVAPKTKDKVVAGGKYKAKAKTKGGREWREKNRKQENVVEPEGSSDESFLDWGNNVKAEPESDANQIVLFRFYTVCLIFEITFFRLKMLVG